MLRGLSIIPLDGRRQSSWGNKTWAISIGVRHEDDEVNSVSAHQWDLHLPNYLFRLGNADRLDTFGVGRMVDPGHNRSCYRY